VDARVSAPWAAPAPSGSRSPAVDNQGHGPQFRCDHHADDNAPPPRAAVQRGVRLGNFAPDGGNSIAFSTTIEIRLSSTGQSFQGLS